MYNPAELNRRDKGNRIRRRQGGTKMKRTMNLLCGALALLCLVSLFIPLIAPRYPASEYHPGSEGYIKDYFLMGDYYCAREYWSLVKFALSSGYRIALSVAAALLLYWATMSLMGERPRIAGVLAATVNLGVTAYLLVEMLKLRASCRWGVLIVLCVDVLVAAAVAWYCFFADREKRYIRIPVVRK